MFITTFTADDTAPFPLFIPEATPIINCKPADVHRPFLVRIRLLMFDITEIRLVFTATDPDIIPLAKPNINEVPTVLKALCLLDIVVIMVFIIVINAEDI